MSVNIHLFPHPSSVFIRTTLPSTSNSKHSNKSFWMQVKSSFQTFPFNYIRTHPSHSVGILVFSPQTVWPQYEAYLLPLVWYSMVYTGTILPLPVLQQYSFSKVLVIIYVKPTTKPHISQAKKATSNFPCSTKVTMEALTP